MSDNMFITDGLNIEALALGGKAAHSAYIGAASGLGGTLPNVSLAGSHTAQVIPNLGAREMGLQ